MDRRRKSQIGLLGVFLVFLTAAGMADPGEGKIECFTQQQPEIYVGTEELGSKRQYTVPRKQVLLEMATATW